MDIVKQEEEIIKILKSNNLNAKEIEIIPVCLGGLANAGTFIIKIHKLTESRNLVEEKYFAKLDFETEDSIKKIMEATEDFNEKNKDGFQAARICGAISQPDKNTVLTISEFFEGMTLKDYFGDKNISKKKIEKMSILLM
jgi:hypothetical protein